MEINFKEFPITRYQGSKRKIASWINQVLKASDCKYENVLDGFGGTGSVSFLFKKLGKSVTYNDSLKFNSLIGKALIENRNIKLSETDINSVLSYHTDYSLVSRIFHDYYFLETENIWIDKTVQGIISLEEQGKIYEASIAYYALFQACLIKRPFNLFHRKNLYIRTNEVERNFGNKTSWEKPFEELFRKFALEANGAIFDNGQVCKALNSSIFDVDELGYDLAYFDPPYFVSRDDHETSNYTRCYHFLEGLSNYAQWESMIDMSSRTRQLTSATSLDRLTKKNISIKLEELIYKFRNSIIVFSYKEGGVPSIAFLEETLKKLGKKVFVESIHYKYALNRQNGDASKNREVLIVAI